MPVPLAHLLAAQFRATPEIMLSTDRYHLSAAAYALAAEQLLAGLHDALREKGYSPIRHSFSPLLRFGALKRTAGSAQKAGTRVAGFSLIVLVVLQVTEQTQDLDVEPDQSHGQA